MSGPIHANHASNALHTSTGSVPRSSSAPTIKMSLGSIVQNGHNCFVVRKLKPDERIIGSLKEPFDFNIDPDNLHGTERRVASLSTSLPTLSANKSPRLFSVVPESVTFKDITFTMETFNAESKARNVALKSLPGVSKSTLDNGIRAFEHMNQKSLPPLPTNCAVGVHSSLLTDDPYVMKRKSLDFVQETAFVIDEMKPMSTTAVRDFAYEHFDKVSPHSKLTVGASASASTYAMENHTFQEQDLDIKALVDRSHDSNMATVYKLRAKLAEAKLREAHLLEHIVQEQDEEKDEMDIMLEEALIEQEEREVKLEKLKRKVDAICASDIALYDKCVEEEKQELLAQLAEYESHEYEVQHGVIKLMGGTDEENGQISNVAKKSSLQRRQPLGGSEIGETSMASLCVEDAQQDIAANSLQYEKTMKASRSVAFNLSAKFNEVNKTVNGVKSIAARLSRRSMSSSEDDRIENVFSPINKIEEVKSAKGIIKSMSSKFGRPIIHDGGKYGKITIPIGDGHIDNKPSPKTTRARIGDNFRSMRSSMSLSHKTPDSI